MRHREVRAETERSPVLACSKFAVAGMVIHSREVEVAGDIGWRLGYHAREELGLALPVVVPMDQHYSQREAVGQ